MLFSGRTLFAATSGVMKGKNTLQNIAAHEFTAKGINSATEAVWHEVVRDLTYSANKLHPTAYPGGAELFQAYWTGDLTLEQLDDGLEFSAIDLGTGVPQNKRQKLWRRVLESQKPTFDPSTTKTLFFRGIINNAQAKWNLRKNGWAHNTMDETWLSFGELLDLDQYYEAYWRNLITEATLNRKIRALGITDDDESSIIKTIAYDKPSLAEIMSLAVRRLYHKGPIIDPAWDAERPEWWDYWARVSGMDGNSVSPIVAGEGGLDPTWARLLWRSHWRELSISDARDFFFRFDAASVAGMQDQFPGLLPFTIDDYREYLRRNNVPPQYRDWFIAASYNLISRRDLQRLIRYNDAREGQISAQLQRQGYMEDDADDIALAMVRQERVRKLGKVREDTKQRILTSYDAGVISRNMAGRQLYRLMLELSSDLVAYDSQPVGVQASLVDTVPEIEATLTAYDLDRQIKIIKRWQLILHKRYLQGVISDAQVQAQLAQLGMIADAVARLLGEWQVEKATQRKEITAAQVLKWGKLGILTLNEVTFRLSNLGYTPVDVILMVAEAQMSLNLAQAKAAAKAAKDSASRAKALIAAQKAAAKAAAAAQKHLMGLGTVAELKKWLKSGYITPKQFSRRLRGEGYQQNDINLLIKEVEDSKKPKKGAASGQATAPKG